MVAVSEAEPPRCTTHAAERWNERTDSPGIGPIVAWTRAERRNDVPQLRGDEFRYHRPTDTLLVARDRVIVTCIDIPSARPQIRRALMEGDADA